MLEVDKEKTLSTIREYIWFLGYKQPTDASEARVYDAKRTKLHKEVARCFGFSPDDTYSRYKDYIRFPCLDNWKEARFTCFKEYTEWLYYYILDRINCDYLYNSVGTEYHTKARMDIILESVKNKIDKCSAHVNPIMEEYTKNCDAYNEDHHFKYGSDDYQQDKSNHHDYNGYVHEIKVNLELIEQFAKLPVEAYLKAAVKAYVDDSIDKINKAIEKLEALAFRAQEQYKTEKFYKYLEGKNKND